MAERIGASEAKEQLSSLLARVAYGRERYIIERRGKPVAALVGVEDLERIEREGGSDSGGRLGALALVGAWGEVEDREMDETLERIYAERERDTGREVNLGA